MEHPTIKNTGERSVPGQSNLYEFERTYRLVSDLYGSKQKVILDYGCGSGYGTFLLSQSFGKVIGLDVSEEAIDYCRRAYDSTNLEFMQFDSEKQPFEDDYFDHIFSFQVFEHIPLELTELYIRNVWRMLKPGGVAIVTTPNANNYYGGFSGNPFHLKEYTKAELETAFQQVIPGDKFRVLAAEDVLSTRIHLATRKFFRQTVPLVLLARILSRLCWELVVKPLKVLERKGFISVDYRTMLKQSGVEEVIGGYYVEVKK